MSFGITFPSNTRDIIDEIRATIGRTITIYTTVSGTPCGTCSLDPVTNLSTDPFCSECEGKYWKDTISGWDVLAHVRWKSTDQPLYTSAGAIEEGDCTVTIAHSGSALTYVQEAVYFVVDGVDLYMKHYLLRGVPPNRIRIILLEDSGQA